ncbi:helix-turn-helix domain-containing transcriptional regulator [Paracraurococcus ruber]|uniref:helix-turn-helix domain-containing transcriptional regulator n=1 Tax=Paracraurococcus ruber TaxID=77675 RepID=UPI0034DE427E
MRRSFASDDPADIAEGLGTVARAIGMSRISSETGLARPALYLAITGGRQTRRSPGWRRY